MPVKNSVPPVLATASPFLTAASKAVRSPVSALLHLDAPIDFDAIDGAPVDLLFVLLVPQAATDAHLELLRQIASMLDRKEVRDKLRSASSNEALYQVVLDEQNGQ